MIRLLLVRRDVAFAVPSDFTAQRTGGQVSGLPRPLVIAGG
jgi:hypothetical protein